MPVHVHVPIRLRVDAAALRQPDVVDGALRRALGRALARSAEALDPMGGYLNAVAEAPTLRWSGPGLPQVSAGVRARMDAQVRAAIADAFANSGLGDRAGDAPQPLGAPAAEAFDPLRTAFPGRYVVDSYEGGQTAVALDRAHTAQPPATLRWDVVDVRMADVNMAEIADFVRDEAAARHMRLEGVRALLVRSPRGWALFASADQFGPRSAVITFGPQTHGRAALGNDGHVAFRDEPIVPPTTEARMTEYALPTDAEERLALLDRLIGARLRGEISALLGPQQARQGLLMTEAEFTEAVVAAAQSQIDAMAFTLVRGHSVALLRIDWGDVAFNIGLPSSLGRAIGWDGSTHATVLPLVREYQGPRQRLFGTGMTGEDATGRPRRPGTGGQRDGSPYGTFGDGTGTGRRIFPALGGGQALVCAPLLGAEAAPEALGAAGAAMLRLVQEIAERLELTVCGYPATFAVGAALMLRARADSIGAAADADQKGTLVQVRRPASAQAQAGETGAPGVRFRPTASRAVQLLRRLAQAAARIAQLRAMVRTTYLDGPGRAALTGDYATNPVSWVLRFEEMMQPALEEAVGAIFTQTCQVLMLQLLASSADQIAARKQNLKAYAPVFADVVVRRLSDVGGLTALRDRLRTHELAQHAGEAAARFRDAQLEQAGDTENEGAAALAAWANAAHAMAEAFQSAHDLGYSPGEAGEIIVQDGVARIRDTNGFLWTRVALERAIFQARGDAESIDPLIQQLADIPDVVNRFRANPASAERLLGDMLEEMARLNAQKQTEARGDPLFGLQAGRIQESAETNQVPGLLYALSGIHLLAHEQIAEFFEGEPIYRDGVDFAFATELGKQGLEHFAVFTGLVLLAVLCPPAAFVAGVEVALVEVDRAEARADLYRALINPELVLNRAEVELERYIAYVGLALSLLPEAGTALRAASVGMRGAARAGLAAGLRIAGRSVARAVSRQITEAAAREMIPALVHELTVNLLMEHVVIPNLVGPLIAEVERELALRVSVGGQAGAEQLIAALERSADARGARPLALEGAH